MEQQKTAKARREIVQERNLYWFPRHAPETPRYEMDRRIEAKKDELRRRSSEYDDIDNW